MFSIISSEDVADFIQKINKQNEYVRYKVNLRKTDPKKYEELIESELLQHRNELIEHFVRLKEQGEKESNPRYKRMPHLSIKEENE